MYKEQDIVRIRHPFLRKRKWRIEKVLPSLAEGIMLYRVQMMYEDGTPNLQMRPIPIRETDIVERIGGYNEWLETLNEN